MFHEAWQFITAFIDAKRAQNLSREQILQQQKRLWQRLQKTLKNVPAYRHIVGQGHANFPIIDIKQFRENFNNYNSLNLTAEKMLRYAAEEEPAQKNTQAAPPKGIPNGLSAGLSTGTSGAQRGLFVTTRLERCAYIAQVLAKLLTLKELLTTRRIALCLRAPNALYRAVNIAGFSLDFYPLSQDLTPILAGISQSDPHILIAPSHVLLALANSSHEKLSGLKKLRRVFYGAEPMSDAERHFIHAHLGIRPDPIYQATEGFLGAPCRLGTLHLNEDSIIFERESLDNHGRFRAIVTDLRRTSQAVIRLKLDDVLQLTTCACGSMNTAILPVEGRISDVWHVNNIQIFPRDIELMVSKNLPPQSEWVVKGHQDHIDYACLNDEDAAKIERALRELGLRLHRIPYSADLNFPKRRRVSWHG